MCVLQRLAARFTSQDLMRSDLLAVKVTLTSGSRNAIKWIWPTESVAKIGDLVFHLFERVATSDHYTGTG